MIGALTGTLLHLFEQKLILDVHGIGYEIFIPKSLPGKLSIKEGDTTLRLYIYTHVTESDLRLFGFSDLKTRQLFEILLGVSGIGPQIALGIVDSISVEGFYHKIYTGASDDLTRIRGIGKKTAERLVVELKDKIAATYVTLLPTARATTILSSLDAATDDALAALVSLGYSRNESLRALEKIPPAEAKNVEEKLKLALGILGRF